MNPIRWSLATLSLSTLLSSLGTSIANVGLPTMAQAFDATFQEVQWIVLAYLLAVTTLVVAAGRLGDIAGRRRLLLAGIFVFTFASVLCGLAPTLPLLIAARAAQGVGAAIMMALTMAFVADTVPKEKSGSAMGLLGTMSAVGTSLGPSLGGLLIAGLGWRSIFFVSLPLGILAFLLAYRYLPVDRRGPGTVRATLDPRVRSAMFRDPALAASLAMSAIVATVMMATLVVGPFYLSGALELDAAAVGLVVSVGPVVAALAGVPAGRLADRFGAQRMTLAGLIGVAAGCFTLSLMPMTAGIPGYIAAMVVTTSGYALFQAANNTAVMSSIRPDQRGAISGMVSLSRNLGLIAGASLMGAVYAASGMRVTFAVAGMLIVGALAIAGGVVGSRLRALKVGS